ncbi:MAG: bifunctional 5,10-methylenetetrahydrofolate dehydrogenase/5,10-methenyltetrahydrofolate cyclohydrolase [Bacteroidales bacterium]|jgi:methylenetetrahydrofolate dehydrogenase (NADP+) / methenyltetrahydrofolate cyclohydrolase|nr:bifunctional 5,10-methylenetetrahydrofolate dehydrogenase/5,10-methenyltetrahydrofolate cyclohydrolase [Bacteroidales bacterium]MDD2205232.1 bifunctional 5,10-methylenetetrahydrofolate dehydrogenase/5,10-methenyltetrahydrofolate cyclohydrolase [Bacteroidales bacterium]MDD3151666.1 bifunctional 5,10-methylenetetrahydrofolate dehydrogenase/5,10-methenyltetrahydrofolate cyclohydrolase [Bacteroidales bacterium]MDD3914683.1 bifunctional 5,10-methylenetetrahydrofolate dehydrogenase/5,10-methenyltet
MTLIDGKLVSSAIKEEIKKEVAGILDSGKRAPHLVAIIVGEDPASMTYVSNKEKACHAVGITSSVYKMPVETTQDELLKVVDFMNRDADIDGIIVQLPLPASIDKNVIINAIDPKKDVDGFHPESVGKMVAGMDTFLPATPYGIVKLLEYYKIETEGKHCVIVGRSNIVGTPAAILLSRKAYPGNCTVTLCHSKTPNIKELCLSADIIIAAIGKPGFITADMVRKGVVVIDVGTNRVESTETKSGYALLGDVDFENVSKVAGYITPVPGGVGPMTITGLIQNTLKAYKQANI